VRGTGRIEPRIRFAREVHLNRRVTQTFLSTVTGGFRSREHSFRDGSAGTIVVPMEKTFWAERFGVVVDRFGITWSINCEA
jgi:uncharacterized glyoxalase superfamily protein PhnB